MLACQRDPLLSTFTTTVLRCDKVEKAPPAAAGKGKKGKKDAAPAPPTEEPKDEWEIELADTGALERSARPGGDKQADSFCSCSPLP